VRVALAGLGSAAVRGHLPALARTPGLTLVAAADPAPVRRAAVALELPVVPVFNSTEAMLQSVPCDLLVVAADSAAHTRLAVLAAEQGRHVLCEKPLALEREQYERVAQVFGQRPSLGLVSVHQYRYSPMWAYMSRCARWADRLGQEFSLLVDVRRHGTDSHAVSPWRADVARSGGMLADHGMHFVALAWTISEDLAVLGAWRTVDEAGREQSAARVRTGSGVLDLRVSAAASSRETSLTLNAFGGALRWADEAASLSVGKRVVHLHPTRALSDRGHLDALYLPLYAELVANLGDAAWRRRRGAEALVVGGALIAMLEAA